MTLSDMSYDRSRNQAVSDNLRLHLLRPATPPAARINLDPSRRFTRWVVRKVVHCAHCPKYRTDLHRRGSFGLSRSEGPQGAAYGGRSWARVASLIETCKLCKVDPLGYLTTTLEAIANGHPKSRLDELLPGPFATASS
jgi:hypothetical protein